jgi:hypothetical protein
MAWPKPSTCGSIGTQTQRLRVDLETLCLALGLSLVHPSFVIMDKLLNVSGLRSPCISNGGDTASTAFENCSSKCKCCVCITHNNWSLNYHDHWTLFYPRPLHFSLPKWTHCQPCGLASSLLRSTALLQMDHNSLLETYWVICPHNLLGPWDPWINDKLFRKSSPRAVLTAWHCAMRKWLSSL